MGQRPIATRFARAHIGPRSFLSTRTGFLAQHFPAMIIKPKVRGFICITSHPKGCAANVASQIDYVKKKGPLASAPKRVLVIGSSTGYGLASRITAAFGGNAATIGVFFEKPAEEGRTGDGLKLPISGRVVFDEVSFRYTPTSPFALNGVSFEIRQGTIFGVMGRSGSGKTTVTRLLQGLNRDYLGTVKIDGMDLRQIDLDHLRNNIGVVPQENFLFSGTVRENIGAARPRAPMEAIVRAAQLAGAEEFIERLPNGYATYVEEGAVNFSGGQRQRLAIARALLVEPQILILDEATSALDAESEAIVNANLLRIAKNRTVIIISHRLSSLVTADAILVLERGKFYDLGRHEELLDRCDIYQSLWYQQNRHLAPKTHARIPSLPTSVV